MADLCRNFQREVAASNTQGSNQRTMSNLNKLSTKFKSIPKSRSQRLTSTSIHRYGDRRLKPSENQMTNHCLYKINSHHNQQTSPLMQAYSPSCNQLEKPQVHLSQTKSNLSLKLKKKVLTYKFLTKNYCIKKKSYLLALVLLLCHQSTSHNLLNAQVYELQSPSNAHTVNDVSDPVSPQVQSATPHQEQTPSQLESNPQPTTATIATTSSDGSSNVAACFGGLQTFEKISMSSFENPAGFSTGGGSSANSPLDSGILIQQDDQALTSECINLCRSQSNCLSFVIDYNKFECKSYATTQQELQQEFAARFQSVRAAANGNSSSNNGDIASEAPNGYQASASSSVPNFQQLLPSSSSNYFEKICLDGVANRNQFSDVCGQGRLWTIERAVDSFLDGFVEKEVTNVNNKDECSKLCIFETQFVCRSADYDQHSRMCRLSKEDRRTQPQAMRYVANSNRQYLENQCATPGPSSCVYETKRNSGIISMDALKFAQTPQDCQMKCNQEMTFNCRSYSFHQQRCFLSGDDSASLNSNLIKLPQKQGWIFGEKKCLVELCTKGIFTYEKITGYSLRSALSTSIDLMMPGSSAVNLQTVVPPPLVRSQPGAQTRMRRLLTPTNNTGSLLASAMMMMMLPPPSSPPSSALQQNDDPLLQEASSRYARSNNNLAITEHCRHSCDLGYLNCPAFTIDYKNNRCQRLDRNSQGRHNELVARDGFSYYEKICLRVPEIMSMCQDKYWIFERAIGFELAPRLYDKTLKFVQSRRDCEEYCLEEKQFGCRSALYNDETSDCKLSRYNRRLAQQEGGFYRNFNVRISYLENNCVRDHHLDKQQCYYEQAKNEPSYPTFTERIEVATSTSSTNDNTINGNNSTNARFRQHGSAYCEQLCNSNSKFECHSFGYYASTAQCFLSGDDSISAGDMAATPSTGFVYYEKKCRLMSQYNETSGNQDQGDRHLGAISSNSSQTNSNPYFQPANQRPNNQPTLTNADLKPTALVPQNNLQAGGNNNNNFQDSGTISNGNNNSKPPTMPNDSGKAEADLYKCGIGHSFVYQRISGFEPIGGYLTLLLKNDEQPGIVSECSELCKRAFECRAFVVDYNNNQCFAMLENSSVGILSLRQTLGKDYFEGFCVADHLLESQQHRHNSEAGTVSTTNSGIGDRSSCRNKTWIIDKIVDQAVFGVQHQRLISDSDRVRCRRACLEERLFFCKSAMFDSSTNDCKLYSIDRESIPQMRLIFTKGVDFYENQCQILSSSCPYDAIERDMTIITITKSVQARSTFDCELACNLETGFNCRSYTYLDQYPSLPNFCLLSSDSRSTSQRGSVREHQKTLYAERNCYYRRPRFPGGSLPPETHHQKYDAFSNPMNVGGLFSPSPPVNGPSQPTLVDPYPSTVTTSIGAQEAMRNLAGSQQPFEKFETSVQPPRISTEKEGSPNGHESSYDVVGPAIGSQACSQHQFTFERTFGYDFKLAPRERAPIAPTIGIAIGCQQECIRRGDKCQSFVVEYALPYQSCFLIEIQAGTNKKLLHKSPNSAYFEKVCLPRTGLVVDLESFGSVSHAPMIDQAASSTSISLQPNSIPDPSQSLDIAPSYSHEPWTFQQSPTQLTHPNQLPYYLQQQHLVQNYPSRACSKLWSFERFVNYNFTAPVDKLIENSLTRAHCETQCINEANFSCRAATYDYGNKICRLFKNTRRTIMSQFIDLSFEQQSTITATGSSYAVAPSSSSTQVSLATSSTTVASLPNSHPGTAHVIEPMDSIQAAANTNDLSSVGGNSNSINVNKRLGGARQLSLQQQQQISATAEPLDQSKNVDYLENTCTPEPSSCQYRQIYDQFSPYIDKVNHAVSLNDCQRQCDQERLFSCKSINYDAASKNCMLVNEDLISLARGSVAGQSTTVVSPLLPKRNTIYSEKGNCEMISVQCNSQEMLVSVNFDSPFRGRIMAKGNPEQCYILGDGQTNLQFSIVFGPKCNSRQEGHNTFVNEVVIQQHPVIMTESDKTVRVMCAFEAPDQTITLKSPTSRDNKTGIDVGTSDASRTRHDKQQFNSVVSSKAAPPSVSLRILDLNGRDASMINLGDDLMLKIQMQMVDGKNSALGIFARNLAARSSNGESLLLIDNEGCPVDSRVFPALEIDQKDGRSLYSTFKAFRFPSSGLVNFEVQIRFCPERCQPVDCHNRQVANQKSHSYGRRKRDVDVKKDALEIKAPLVSSMGRSPILQSLQSEQIQPSSVTLNGKTSITSLDSLSTVMKPGKAFEYVRKLMLPQQDFSSDFQQQSSTAELPSPNSSIQDSSQQNVAQDANISDFSTSSPNSNSMETGTIDSPPSTDLNTSPPQNEDFDNNSPTSGFVDEANMTKQSNTLSVIDDQHFSQPDFSRSHAGDKRDSFTPLQPTQVPIVHQSHQQKSIQIFASEKSGSSRNPFSEEGAPAATNDGFKLHMRTSSLAPYGNFQPSSSAGIHHSSDMNALPQQPTNTPQQSVTQVLASNDNLQQSNDVQENSNPKSGQDSHQNLSEQFSQNIDQFAVEQQRQTLIAQSQVATKQQNSLSNPKDMPLKFSILVGENNLPQLSNGQLVVDQPPIIMNSTNMDLDHIVIPGRKGQFEDRDLSSNPQTTFAPPPVSSSGSFADGAEFAQDSTGSGGRGRSRETNKRNASYEQTFDALPSSSVSSEIHINHHTPTSKLNVHNPDFVIQRHHKLQTNRHNILDSTLGSESAASHDCQGESGKSKIRAIIWTGSIVIGLNVCLVVLSLIIYFRKLRSRQNHTIVRSSSDCGTTGRSSAFEGSASASTGCKLTRGGAGHWPSVILKGKNKLGTSLNTHEHFFCKLYSKPTGGSNSGLEHDFNWPNLSSSSSRSTVSSLASPMPSTSIRINQMRPSIKSTPFDAHSTLRSGNFVPGHETHKGSTIMDESDNEGEFSARYTNNVDAHRSERF